MAPECHLQGLPKEGTLVPKHVEAGTYHELCFMICILLTLILLMWRIG